jgi:hypothetical protein
LGRTVGNRRHSSEVEGAGGGVVVAEGIQLERSPATHTRGVGDGGERREEVSRLEGEGSSRMQGRRGRPPGACCRSLTGGPLKHPANGTTNASSVPEPEMGDQQSTPIDEPPGKSAHSTPRLWGYSERSPERKEGKREGHQSAWSSKPVVYEWRFNPKSGPAETVSSEPMTGADKQNADQAPEQATGPALIAEPKPGLQDTG